MHSKYLQKIFNIPLALSAGYIVFSMFLFVISPMFPYADNRILTISYGIAAVTFFIVGYRICSARVQMASTAYVGGSYRLDAIIILACISNVIYYVPQINSSLNYYGFSILDSFNDIGMNYLTKDELIEDLGYESLGLLYTILNILAFFQIFAFVVPFFKWKDIGVFAKIATVLSIVVVTFFYIVIGTMSGVFYVVTLSFAGWLAAQYFGRLGSFDSMQAAVKKSVRIIAYGLMVGFAFFLFMVFNLSSRSERINVNLPLLYDDGSIVYSIFGHRVGDGIGLALAYISHGWYGLGKSFEVDFLWTHGLSFSRVLTSYYYRFAGIVGDPIPLSYPVRQENITGYPPFSYWSTAFPWLASDFTFAGALVLTAVFGAFYAKMWIGAVREGCLVSVTLFGLLTIGALFLNANMQIADNKMLMLAFLALCCMYPFRGVINRAIMA